MEPMMVKLILLLGVVNAINGVTSSRIVCYYDTRSSLKEGELKEHWALYRE
jgi:hypothetical protein